MLDFPILSYIFVTGLSGGKSFAETWQTVKNDFENIGAGYFETVYRTNIQSSYSAGRLLQYQNNMPPAWELLVIEDGRTSDICKGIVSQIGNGHALPSNHYFWKKVGFPPYHFNCQTSFRAVYDYEIKDGTTKLVDTPLKNIRFKAQEGFGGQTLSTGSWWKLTKGMIRRAKKYGLKKEFDDALQKVVETGGRKLGKFAPDPEVSEFIRQEEYAKKFYTAIRKRKPTDIPKIAKNSGFKTEEVKAIREHLFTQKHELENGFTYFAADPNIAHAWERLERGNHTDTDILLLKHEYMELTLMKEKGYNYVEAHELTEKKYAWDVAIKKLKGKR